MDKNFINDISIMIEDKRLIDSIINEFIIYKNKFNLKEIQYLFYHMEIEKVFILLKYNVKMLALILVSH